MCNFSYIYKQNYKSEKQKGKSAYFYADALPGYKVLPGLFSLGCSYRACCRASAAFNAGVCVNNIFVVALCDCSDGAVCRASAAGDAVVFDFVCH